MASNRNQHKDPIIRVADCVMRRNSHLNPKGFYLVVGFLFFRQKNIMTPMFIVIWIILSGLVALYGRKRSINFVLLFVLSILFSPLLGLLVVATYKTNTPRRTKLLAFIFVGLLIFFLDVIFYGTIFGGFSTKQTSQLSPTPNSNSTAPRIVKRVIKSPAPTYQAPTPTPTQAPNPIPYNINASVVNVFCFSKDRTDTRSGSGTILTKDGLILTNAHIIPQIGETPNVDDNGCRVVLPNARTGQPKEIYWAQPTIVPTFSKEYDIATLKIAAVYTGSSGKPLGTFPNTFPAFQDSTPDCHNRDINLGEAIKIYGYPITSGGANLTVTEGVVSAYNNDGTLLTSAKIDHGNSGGLAVSQDGCYVGIPSAVVKGDFQNLGVIIPNSLIKKFLDKIP